MFFDKRPTDEPCRALIAGLEPVAPDGVLAIAEPGIAMAFGACHVWTGERSCRQPYRSAAHVVTWDGRLDNRDDLLMRLDGRLAKDTSDVAIATSVFERWGIDGLRSLVGDWSVAIWDSRARVLHLARDYMGVRPLYYHVGDDAVMWSTSLGELATRAGRADDLNEAFVARFMTLQFSTDVTPYKGIHAVPTATCVSISDVGVETRRPFWRLEAGSIRYRDPGQYEEHLRALWAEAVGSRLRTEGTVWAELSGGLDSSSVVCMADALVKAGRVGARDLQTVSHVTLESAEGDERRFIAEVEAKTDRPSCLFGLEAHDADCDEWDWVSPLSSRGVDVAIARHIRRRSGHLVLSGRVGDVVMGCFPDHSVAVFDDVADGRLATALVNMRLWSRVSQKPIIEIAGHLVRAVVRAKCKSPTALDFTANQRAGLHLLAPGLREIAVDHAPPIFDGSGLRLSTCNMAALLLRYSCGALSSLPTPPPDLVYTHPFVHRPLVDFMLAIPAGELSAPGVTRSLMRRAFKELVPTRVLSRTSKGYYPPAVMRTIRQLMKSMPPVESLQIVQRGWLGAQPLAAAIRNLAEGGAQMGGEVRFALLVEQWLTARDRRGPAAMPQRKEVITNAVLNA